MQVVCRLLVLCGGKTTGVECGILKGRIAYFFCVVYQCFTLVDYMFDVTVKGLCCICGIKTHTLSVWFL